MTETDAENCIYGTPDFSVLLLKPDCQSASGCHCRLYSPPRPAGRGQLKLSPVHIIADQHNIPVYTPKNLKKVHPMFKIL